MFATVKDVTNFINESAKRRYIALSVQPGNSKRQLVTLCETRFIESHDALIVFSKQYSYMFKTLDAIAQQSHDRKAIDKVISLSRAMTDSSFIVALSCAKKVMDMTSVFSRSLLKVNQDLFEAMESVSFVTQQLTKCRNSSEVDDLDHLDAWEDAKIGAFSTASDIAVAAGIVLTTPRIVGRQTTRNNTQASNTCEYYRRAVWYPYIDCIITTMKDKFSVHHLTVMKLVALVPSVIEKKEWKDIAEAVLFYKSGGVANLASEEELCNEFKQWKAFSLRMPAQDRPKLPLKALDIIPQ